MGRLSLSHSPPTRGNWGNELVAFINPTLFSPLPYIILPPSPTTTQPFSSTTLYLLSLSCSCTVQSLNSLEETAATAAPTALDRPQTPSCWAHANWFQAQPLFLNAAPSAVILLRFLAPPGPSDCVISDTLIAFRHTTLAHRVSACPPIPPGPHHTWVVCKVSP